MFELPEIATLARQANATIRGKTIGRAEIGRSPHKFVWYNRAPEEFAALAAGCTIGVATGRGKWLFVPLETGFVLLCGEIGGRLLYHEPGARVPDRHHLSITFDDGSALTAVTQMWGAYELHERGREQERQ